MCCARSKRTLSPGAQEIVLTGIDLTSWGQDMEGAPGLGVLVAAILKTFPALPRLRLSSVDGIEIDPLLFDLIAHEPRIMPHLHLSLQHGADLILKRMKRRHLRRDAVGLGEPVEGAAARYRDRRRSDRGLPRPRTKATTRRTSSIIDEPTSFTPISSLFPPAPARLPARMPQVARDVVKARAAAMRARAAARRAVWLDSLVGETLPVLAERDGTGYAPKLRPRRPCPLPPRRAR